MAYAFNNLVQRLEMMADRKTQGMQAEKKVLGDECKQITKLLGLRLDFLQGLVYPSLSPSCFISIIPSGFAPVLVFHVFKVFNYSLKTEKRKKNYFEKATENGIMGSKKFWSTVKSFLSSKASFIIIT